MPSNEIISHKVNDITLCPDAKSSKYCGFYDVSYFTVDKIRKCKKIKLLQTGLSAANQNCIDIAAIELFGKLFFPSCSFKQTEMKQFLYVFICLLISCYK